MAKKRKRKTVEFEGATCHRCGLPLDEEEGTCPNDRCPFHLGVTRRPLPWTPFAVKELWR